MENILRGKYGKFFLNTLLPLRHFKNMNLKCEGESRKSCEPKTKRKEIKHKSNKEKYLCMAELIYPHHIT